MVDVVRMNENSVLKTVGAVAGIGGIAIAVLMLIYRELIRSNLLSIIQPDHAAAIIAAIVILTFFVEIFGVYCWLVNSRRRFISEKAWIFVSITN